MAKSKTIDLQLSEVDLQALESIGVISVQDNMEIASIDCEQTLPSRNDASMHLDWD